MPAISTLKTALLCLLPKGSTVRIRLIGASLRGSGKEQQMLLAGYDVAKAAQAVVFFAQKDGGSINVLKLAKLLYLAERESMERYDSPMFYDHLVSMPDGPVTSITLNLINGAAQDQVWTRYVAPREKHTIRPARQLEIRDLDHLSRADLEVLEMLFDRFGNYDGYRLRDWTHNNVPEWEDPQGSSYTIPFDRIFTKLNKENAKDLARDIDQYRRLAKELSKSQ